MEYSKRYSKRKPSPTFGAYLRRLREKNTRFSQTGAARELDLNSRQELNQYEQGNRVPSDAFLLKLANLYHVPTAEVLERAYWPQLVLLPLIAIIDPERLPRDLIEELEKGLKDEERRRVTRHIEVLLRKRCAIK